MKNKTQLKSLIWILPAIFAFIIALIPTIKYQWPLSWDIIIHVQYAMVYSKYGFVLTDPLLNAPVGQKIGYPPLFHFILIFLGIITKINYFQIARALQPFLAMSIVLSVSFVARKLYGTIAGISAGFLILSSVMVGRILLPIPENLALIFLPLTAYFYYHSIQKKSTKFAFIPGFLFLITILTHQAAAIILFLIISLFSLIELVIYRNIQVFKNYVIFLILTGSLLIIAVLAMLIWQPDIINSIFYQGISAATGLMTSISTNRPLNIQGYLDIGYLVLIFGLIGMFFSLKRRDKTDLFVLFWILLMFLLSIAYCFGINVISYRLLVYLLIPLSIIGGYGLNEIFCKLKNYKNLSEVKFNSLLLIGVFILSLASGVLTVQDTDFATFEVKNQYGTLEIAPPSTSMVDLANWFNENGNKDRSILTNNLFTGTFIATETGMSIHYGFEDFNKNIPPSAFKEAKIGYLVLDKRLSLNNADPVQLILIKSEFYPLVYISKPVSSSLPEMLPDFIKVVWENQDYIICEINI